MLSYPQKQAQKGIFITIVSYSNRAREYVKMAPQFEQ